MSFLVRPLRRATLLQHHRDEACSYGCTDYAQEEVLQVSTLEKPTREAAVVIYLSSLQDHHWRDHDLHRYWARKLLQDSEQP